MLSVIYALDIGVRFFGLGWSSFRANGWNIFDVVVVAGSITTTVSSLAGSTGFAVQQLQKLFLVSIAFKLVQRNNSLNQLFKTSVYVRHSLHQLCHSDWIGLCYVSQCKSPCDPKPLTLVVCFISVLCHPFCGSFWLDPLGKC